MGKAKSVYRALEELGSKHARLRLQTQCFVRRKDLQKHEYKQVMLGREKEREDDDDEEDGPSLEGRLIAGARYSRAKGAQATLLYGESPWRIIGTSLVIILGFTLLYPLGGWVRPVGGNQITYSRIAEAPHLFGDVFYFSTLTFTTLGLGDYRPVGLSQYLTTANTALGAVLIALLVFVLGRRATR